MRQNIASRKTTIKWNENYTNMDATYLPADKSKFDNHYYARQKLVACCLTVNYEEVHVYTFIPLTSMSHTHTQIPRSHTHLCTEPLLTTNLRERVYLSTEPG